MTRDQPHWSRLSTAQRFQPPNVNHYAETGHCPENGADKLWSEDGKSYARCQRCKATTRATVSGLTYKHKPRCEATRHGRRCTNADGPHEFHRAVEGSHAYSWPRGPIDDTAEPSPAFRMPNVNAMTLQEVAALATRIDAVGAAGGVAASQEFEDDLTTERGRISARAGERGYVGVCLRMVSVQFAETGSVNAHVLASALAYMAENDRRFREARSI